MMPDEELAALREENARLKAIVEPEDVCLADAYDKAEAECNQLRAQVAALVQLIDEIPVLVGDEEDVRAWYVRAGKFLDVPDLAALVAREQAREAVIAAARRESTPHWELGEALTALDAVEKS